MCFFTFRLFSFILVYALFSVWIYEIYSITVGIDIGSDSIKIGYIPTKGAIQILTNDQSERKTPFVISFAGAKRQIGSAAENFTERFPHDSIRFPSLLFNWNENHLFFQRYQDSYLPYKISLDNKLNKPILYLRDATLKLTPEEVFAHVLQQISLFWNSENVEVSIAKNDINAVITVPESFGMRQRQAIVQAAEIANFTIIGILSDTQAASLYHCLDLNPEYSGIKLFINLGNMKTQICLIQYKFVPETSRKPLCQAEVLQCLESNKIGGQHFTWSLLDHVLDLIKKKYDIVSLTPKKYQTLLYQIGKAKIVLSSNRQCHISVDRVHENKSFSTVIKREVLEKLIKSDIEQLKPLIHELFKLTNIQQSAVESVEIIGGGWRVPFVQNPLKLGQHLNSDESIALGATYVAALYSPLHKLNRMRLISKSYFKYILKYNYISNTDFESINRPFKDEQSIDLFESIITNKIKKIKFVSCNDIILGLIEVDPLNKAILLDKFIITGTLNGCKELYNHLGDASIRIQFEIDTNGIIHISQATAEWRETILKEKKIETSQLINEPEVFSSSTTDSIPSSTTSNEQPPSSSSSNEQPPSSSSSNEQLPSSSSLNEQPPLPHKDDDDDDNKQESKMNSNTSSDAPKAATPKIEYVKIQNKHEIKLVITKIEEGSKTLSNEYLDEAKTLFAKLVQNDFNLLKKQKLFNNFESALYSLKDYLENSLFIQITDEETRKEIKSLVEKNEDWLASIDYDNNDESIINVVNSKMKDLTDLIDPILSRKNEIESRNRLNQLVDHFKNEIHKKFINTGLSDYVKKKNNNNDEFLKNWQEFLESFTVANELQKKKSYNEEPAYKTKDFFEKLNNLAYQFKSTLEMALNEKNIEIQKTLNSDANHTTEQSETPTMEDKMESLIPNIDEL